MGGSQRENNSLLIPNYSINFDLHHFWRKNCEGQPGEPYRFSIPILVLTGVMIVFRKMIPYLDQPTRGGTAQEPAMIQVNAQPTAAWVALNLKLPMGLQTTMYLSIARTTRDHKATWPVEKNRQSSKPVATTQGTRTFKNSFGYRHSSVYPISPPRVAMNPSMVQLIRPKAKYPIMQE